MATTYTVTATRMFVRQDDGTDKEYRRGDSVSGLSSDDVERFKKAGAIASGEEAQRAKATPEPNPDDVEVSEPLPTGITRPQASEIVPDVASAPPMARPAKAANKEAWVDYAVRSGQMTQDDAEAKSRDKLRDELT